MNDVEIKCLEEITLGEENCVKVNLPDLSEDGSFPKG